MHVRQWKRVVVNVAHDVNQNHIFSFAAALSYYFLLALFPALIALAAFVAYLPIPNLLNAIVSGNGARGAAPKAWDLVRRVVADVTLAQHGALLSFGLLAALWTCSSGFAAMIEALNVAYDVPETRPMWKTRLLALELTFLVGTLVAVAFAFMMVGPRFGEFLAGATLDSPEPSRCSGRSALHVVAATFIVLAVEGLYFLAPNFKQVLRISLPGAVLAVVGWILLSDG